jgi:hypothetical protein
VIRLSLRAVPTDWGGLIAVGFRCLGWLAVTTLCAFGCLALIALTFGSFTLDGTMLQMNNLTARFVAADPVRQQQFHTILVSTFAGVFSLVALVRRRSMIEAIFSEKGL